MNSLAALLREEIPPLSTRTKDEMRARLIVHARLAARSDRRVVKRRVVASGAALAVVAILAMTHLISREAHEPVQHATVRRGTVRGTGGYIQVSAQPDEVIRLLEGQITVEVEHLEPGERFRVVAGDGEVEVRGTEFEVTSVNDQLRRVRVIRGRVEVRTRGEMIVLDDGEFWEPTVAAVALEEVPEEEPRATSIPPAPHAAIPSRRARAESATPPSVPEVMPSSPPHTSPSTAEIAFQNGWHALQNGSPARAAAAFQEVPDDVPLAEDALFWEGVAWRRAGRVAEARRAFGRFEATYQESSRLGEVAYTLGRMHARDGDLAGARRLFERAAEDANPAVRSRALRALAEL